MPNDKTQKNLSSLHNTLETMGYEVPNIDQFTKYMRKEKNLRTVYDAIASDGGYELPDFETFKADMGWVKPTSAGVPTPLRPKDQLAPTGKPDAPATPFGFDLPANPKKPSHAPKARLGFPRLDKKMRPVQEVNDPSVPLLKTTRDVAQDENGNVVNVVQPELVPDFDPNNGGVTAPKALLDVTTGKTIRPTELSKEEVDGYNAGNIDAGKDPKLRQALKEANIVYAPDVDMDKVHRGQVRDLEQEIDADLKTAYDSFTDKAAAKAKDTRNLMRFGLATAGASMGGGATTMGMHANPLAVESDPEIYMLKLAKHNIQDAKNYIAEADHNAQEGTFSKWLESSFAGGAARGFAQKLFDARTWDMGIGDAGEAASIKAAVNKADLGEKLTPAEDKLLQSMVTKMAVEAYFNSQVGHGYTAGSVSAYSIPFMLEMAASPVSTSGNAIGAKLMRYAVRKFGLNVAGKALRKKAVKAVVKYGVGGLTSAAVSSAALTATSGTAHVAADAVSRNTGDLKFDYKEDPKTGELRAQYSGHEEGDDALTATGKAFFMRFMENFSEYSGEALAPIAAGVAKGVGAGAKAAGKAVASRMGKAGAKILDAGRWGTKAARELIDNISASEFGRTITALEKKAHYNGKVLEFAEEKISDLAAVLIGDKDLSTDKGKGFFNLEDNIDTFLGVSLTGGVISAAQTAGYFAGGGARGMARYQIGQSEGAVWSTLTTDEQRKAWDDVRRQILLQDGKEQVDAVKSALTNPNFNAEQRRAILDYTKSVQTYKGMSEYRRKQSEDTKADPLQNELADSYDKGAGMTEAEEMSHARSWYEFAQQKAAERLGVDANALDEMGAPDQLTLDQVAQLREEHNEQAVQSYVDYLNARATYEGMIGSVSQGIQAEAAQAEQAVRSQQHKDGTLRRATLRGTEGQNVEVHIKDGDLVMDEEGRIDTDKSSKDFIVRDNETGVVRFASIDDIINAEQPTSADDAVSEAVNAVYERREKEAADAINGTITPQAGAVYNLLDADGNPQQIAIRQVGQDGTLDVDYSGVPYKMTTDELQSMADNTRARQVENEHAAQVQQAKAEEREEREQAGLPRYALNDELTIRTPEGEEVTAYVTDEEDADGNIEVYFNEPFDGKKVHLFTKDYLDGVVVGTRLSPETNTSAGTVEAPATAAAPALAQAQPVSEEVPEEATTAPTPTQEEENDIIGRSMTEEEAEAFLTAISNNHEVAPELELTPENWYAEFGEDGVVHTPIGDAHMGENQFLKMMRDGRKSKLGMIRPTLEAPHAIVEEPSMAKEGQETERDSSYIYIRVFEKEDGSRHYHFTSVSVQRDGGEVIVSNQEKSRNQVKRLLTEGVVLWMRADNAPDTSDVDQDLYSSQGTELSDPASEGTDASQSTPSESKDNESTSHADPNDESLSPEEAYEAVLRAANGDAALALEVIKSTITDKEKALTKAKKAKPRSANTIDGKIQALAEVASGIEAAETSLAHWQAVAEIAAEQVQEEVTEVAEPVAEQTEQESEEPTTEQAPAEEETTEEEEQEEEATPVSEDTAPEWGKDNPADARARGYIKVEGLRVERQGELSDALIGKESDVKFATNDTQQARYAIIEAESLQPSHIRGYQNQLHFIPEAQPKDRSDVVSEQAAVRIAANINPEEITTSATAYTGAPTINARGEVIQGNSRADALRAVWESFRDTSGAKYKQYLIENAEALGIDPEAIEGMKSPVLVHLADVSDERAIELGQYRQADIESGGVERINPQTLYAKIGEKRDTFIRFLLGTSDDDLSLAESITRNAAETLSWLNRQGFISDTQFRSVFGTKGEITAEAKEDLRNTLYRSFFEGAHNSLEAEFYNLPKRTQQALLRVSYRDQQSPADAHFLDELQASVSAYNALMGYAPFAEAKTFEDAEHAIETWMRFSGDLITGEVNSEQYSNFAVQLALRYKFYTQKELIAKLNAVYDAVQAVSEDTLFGEGEVKPKTLAEAVSEVFSIKYDNKTEEDGSIGSSSTGGNSQGSNGGEQEGQGTPGGDEQDQSRAGTPERRGGAASDPQEGEGVTTETEEVAPEAGDTQASDATGEGYRLSAIAAKRGGNFFENSEGSIDLVKISDNVFEAIGIKPLPMRMTEAMAQHIIKQHAKELGISTQEEAVAFVVDIMQNFDHVREGNKPNTYIFSIEKGRSRTGKKAVTLVLPSKSGEYLGVSSSGYEKVSRLKERALLWEEGANNMAPTTETASANVTSPSATQGGMTGGSASNQSNALSQGKDSEKDTAEGEANDDNQDDLSIEEKEALLSKAKQELVEKEEERTAVAEQAIALMKDYYDSGAIPGMDSGEFHGQATLILIGFKDRSNLDLMKAPGLSELLPSLYKLADEARAKKALIRKYEKELSQAKEGEGETSTYNDAIRDELVNTMRDAGIEVVTDEAEGQAVLDAVRAGDAQMQRAYHGTDADFEAFDHSHMGEGAGGQAYGWGSYFTEEEGVARSYAGGGFVYEAELPDDTGSNYLHFESKPSNKDIARVKRELVEYILRNDEEGMYDYPQGKDDLTQEVDEAGEPTTWRDLYGTVSSHLGSDKEASAFFHSIGYVGIQYNSSETDGGKKNLVIFDESDISIQSKVRLFKTTSGEVYGFVKDGKIYLDLKHATAETAIHEYTHLWASTLRRVNPRAWKSIRKQLKGFELWADIASRYPELKGDEDALADEVLAQYSGKRGAQRIEEEMKKAENTTDLVGKARVLAAFNSLKEALKTFWTEVADFFGMDYYKSVEDAADKAMSDLLRGVNPNAVEAKEETTKKKPTKKATAKKETATSSVIAPDSERYNGYIVTLPKSGKAGTEVGNIEEFVGADEMREGLMVVYQAPEGFAVASNGTMAIADKTQFDVYKKGKAYKLDGTTIDAGAWKPLKDKWQSFVSTETRGENSDPFTESPVNITRLSKYLDRVEQDLYNRWKTDKSEGITRDSFKAYRGRALVSIPNGRGGYVSYPYTGLRTIALAAKRLGVTSFFVEGDLHSGSSAQPGRRLVGNGRLGSVVHAGYFETRDPNSSKRKELSYLYDESVGVKDIDEGVRMQKGDEGLSLQETSDAINARFNEELKEQIEGTLPKGHIYSLGMPSNALRSAGVPNLPIELTARRLATKASQEYHSEHPFELSDIQNLPQAIAHPIAVFDSSTRSDSTVVLTELQDSRGVNFVVALRVVKSSASRSLEIDVNGIRSIYPKDRVTSILKWITSGKMLWVDKKKALSWITTQLPNAGYDSNATESLQDSEGRLDKQRSNSADVIKPKLQASDGEANKQRSNSAEVISHPQEDGLSKTKIAQQRTNLADVDYLDLDNATKVVETFDNPPLASEDLEISNDNQASEDNDEEVRYRSSRLSPELQAIKDQAKADGSFMKAPNGRPTNLTEKQWLQVRTPEFKEWFGDWENDPTNASKVVDENGEPMVVYHGSRNSLTYFSKNFAGKNNPDIDVSRLGFFFTDDIEEAKYYTEKTTNDGYERDGDTPQVYSTFLNLRDPYEVATGEDATYYIDNNTRVLYAEDNGYDGVIVQGESNVVYLAFEPNNIKSATENSGSFDGMNDDIRYSSHNAVEQDDLDIQDLEEVATSMAEVLGEDVRVIHDTAEIEGRNESETSRMRGAKGWYDPKTGQVVVVLPNAESADDVEATILHEVVGHKGLQELVGKDQFGKFLDEVFEGANEAVRNGIVERSKRYGWNTRLATEEYIAELAEQGFKDLEARDLWHVVRNAFYNLLSRVKLALGWDISDRELRYMLWRTYQMKKGEGLMGQAKDIAMQEKLGVGNYEEARFRQGEAAAPVKVAATYDALIKKSSYQTQEALQDSMLSLKKVMEMIMQAKGDAKYIEEIEGYQNAYMGENRVSSVNQAEAAAYTRMALEPLVEEVSRLAKKAHHSYVTDYMMAKHGLERNRVMAFQKAVESDVDAHNKAVKESGEGEELTASSLWDAYLNDTDRLRNEADYREGRITADVWHKTDDEIRARYAPSYAEYRERDYAGLTGLLDRADEDIQTIEAEAIEEVMKFEQENDVTDLWDLTNKATDAPLSKQYEGGLMSRETLEHVRNMYGYYIPLRGFDETTSDEAYSYLGDRDRAFSPTLKKAKGRSSKAEDPLAHIASMMESAILQSNRNKLVRQKFLNFVENNPSDLFSVQKLWVKWNEVTKAWEAVLPEFDPNDTSEEVIRKTQEFEEMMRENKRKDPKNFKLASEQPSIPYRVVSLGEQMQHQIIVKRGGRDVVIIVNGDPRVAMAVNGQTNPDGEAKGHIGALFRAGAAVNRKLAGFYTSLSPNFVVKNFIRDIIYANTIAWVKESPTYAMTYHANVAKLAGQMHRLVHLYEHDKLDMSNETQRMFKLFMANGGETGYSQLRSMDRHKKEIERMMKESGGRISPKQAFRLLGDTMEFANRGIEDLSRFAAFLTSRQMGRTIDRSIYDAKEMTVNFNKKGAGSTFYDATTQSRLGNAAALLSGTGRSLYLFWNVSIQGSVNIARAVKRNPKKGTAYLATFLALGILQTMLPALTGGDDDDRYWNLPDYVRRNNICFFVGDVLVKIPLPQEARAIFGIGELGMSYSSGKEDKTPMELAQTIAGQISQVMPLDLMDDSGATHALMPSLAKPFFEAQTNHSWMGRPIWKDTDYNKAMPDWTKAYKATGGAYVWLAKELNAITGGDDYKQGWVNINPAKLEYMLKGYLGGLYTAADQIIKSSETAFGDRDFSMRDVPILSGFLDGADERNDMRNVNNTYYHFKEEAKEVLRLGKSYERDAEQGKGDYAKKLDELVNNKSYERALLFDDLSKEIEEMQKALKEATDPKEAEELQAEIDKQKKALVIQLRQMK
nr:MAG TPA: ParB ddrB-like ParB superfamily domain [Caudoviricetes sp.]